MIHYNSNELSAKTAYKFLSGSIIPRPIAGLQHKIQPQVSSTLPPFSFFNAAAAEIPLATLSIYDQSNSLKIRHETSLVLKNLSSISLTKTFLLK